MNTAEGKPSWLLADSQALAALAEDHGLSHEFRVASELSSTQDYLLNLPISDLAQGLTVIADYQSAGRGRLDRTWIARPGTSLLMSSVVHSAEPLPWLPMAVGLAVLQAIEPQVPLAALKWPNDLVIPRADAEPYKLGGIVIAQRPAPAGWFALVGIGVNLYLDEQDRPTEFARGLSDFTAHPPERNHLAINILNNLQQLLHAPQTIAGKYRNACCTIGLNVNANLQNGESVIGRAVAVDDFGSLQIQTSDETLTLSAGDVQHLRSQ